MLLISIHVLFLIQLLISWKETAQENKEISGVDVHCSRVDVEKRKIWGRVGRIEREIQRDKEREIRKERERERVGERECNWVDKLPVLPLVLVLGFGQWEWRECSTQPTGRSRDKTRKDCVKIVKVEKEEEINEDEEADRRYSEWSR